MRRLADVFGRVRARFGAVLGFSAALGVLEIAVFGPLAALLLRLFLSQHGKASVGNFEIATFFLSPIGVVAIFVLGTLGLGGAWLRLVGLLRILGDPPVTVLAAFRGNFRGGHRLFRLALLQIGAILLVATPLLLATVWIVTSMWSGWDLNALFVLKPPVLWQGLAAAAAPVLLLVGILVWLSLRWLFAPSVLLDQPGIRPVAALAESGKRTRGLHGKHARALVTWAVVVGLVTAGIHFVVLALARSLLGSLGTGGLGVLAATGTVVVLWFALSLVLTWTGFALLAGLIDRLHHEALGRPPSTGAPPPEVRPRRSLLVQAGVVLVVLALLAGGAGYALLATQRLSDDVEITAHRMGAFAAPENTLAALKQAIVEGADWAELDVQLTRDGVLVVLHDFDLLRIGGPAKKVADATAEEVRAIDVGTGLKMPAFAGERVPTLDEVIAAAGDRIRLNIELKPPTAAAVPALTDAVLATVRRTGLVERCVLCSQSYEAMQRAKKAEPKLRVGFIAGAALGDLTGLEVDFLMVNAGMATRRFVRSARARGMEVHPWTVNDVERLLPLLDNGVHNVITDAPGAMRRRLAEVQALSVPDRVLLRVRNWLAE